MKDKKYIAILLVTFLVFVVLGKYTQSTALTSASVVYATTVKDKETGEKVRFEVRRLKNNKFKVTNTKTGKSYETKPQTIAENYLRINLGDKNHQEGSLVLKKGISPLSQPTLEIQNSDKYEQVSKTTTISTLSSSQLKEDNYDDSSSSVSASSSSSDAKTTDKTSSSSTDGNKTDDSSSASSSNSSTSSSASKSSSRSEVKTIHLDNLTEQNIKDINKEFKNWLVSSKYGKDSVVVDGKFEGIINTGATSTLFRIADSEDGLILGNLIGLYEGSISKGHDFYVKDKDNASAQDFIDYKNSFKIAMLGEDLSSDNAESFQSTSAFRVYTLKDTSLGKGGYTSNDEYKIVEKNVPSDKNMGATNNGYDYYYENLVDQSKDSYQIILANNGVVYYVKDYWIKDYFKDREKTPKYIKAPEDMQTEFQDLLKDYYDKEKESDKDTETEASEEVDKDKEDKEESSAKHMDISAIQNEDFSSIEGDWINGKGRSMHIYSNGNIDGGDTFINVKYANVKDGTLNAGVTYGMYGAGLVLSPIGSNMGSVVDGDTDTSRDRILITQSTVQPDEVFYRK